MERMIKRIAIRKDGTISMSEFRNFAEEYQGKINELEEENKKLKDSNTILKKGGQVVFTLEKRIDKLLEENKKLKSEIKELNADLEHRDSFFSIMRDVLANEEIDNEQLAAILYCVVHEECGDYDLSKKELKIAKEFWRRKYV